MQSFIRLNTTEPYGGTAVVIGVNAIVSYTAVPAGPHRGTLVRLASGEKLNVAQSMAAIDAIIRMIGTSTDRTGVFALPPPGED